MSGESTYCSKWLGPNANVVKSHKTSVSVAVPNKDVKENLTAWVITFFIFTYFRFYGRGLQIYEYFSLAANYRGFVMLLFSVNGNVILPRFSEEFRYPVVLFLIQTLTPQVAQDILGARIIVSFKQ